MKERPILFSGPMVRAILEGRKTVTRRAVKPWQVPTLQEDGRWLATAQRHARWGFGVDGKDAQACAAELASSGCCPYGSPGRRLWVRETYADIGCRLTYRADTDDGAHCMVKKWIPSIHMPRSACRLMLEVTAVRVERLQDISEEQAIAEGPPGLTFPAPPGSHWVTEDGRRRAFMRLWDDVNGAGAWDANPWVWVVEFKRVTQ